MQDEAGIAYDTIQSREAKGKGRGDLLDICIGIKKKKKNYSGKTVEPRR